MEVILIIILTIVTAMASLSSGIKIFDSPELRHLKGADKPNWLSRWTTGVVLLTIRVPGRIRRGWTRITGR